MKRVLAIMGVIGLVAITLIIGVAANPTAAADHLDAPFVKKDGRIDINDIYVFHPGSPGSQKLDRTVLVMTVNPAAGVISGTGLRPDALYEFLIDTNQDAVEDIVYRLRFSGKQGQNVVLRKGGQKIAQGRVEETIPVNGGGSLFVGLRDDPFFFDLANFNNGATFCGSGLPVTDFFQGLNTTAIVLEVKSSELGKSIGVWGRTVVEDKQVERMGRPAILTVFIPPNPFEPGDDKAGNPEDQFNFTKPNKDQARWRGEIINTLLALGNDQARADSLADVLLPDILTVDLRQETGFLNGRNLADDVIDAELNLITNGAIPTDCVDSNSTFLANFPYLGVPNE